MCGRRNTCTMVCLMKSLLLAWSIMIATRAIDLVRSLYDVGILRVWLINTDVNRDVTLQLFSAYYLAA